MGDKLGCLLGTPQGSRATGVIGAGDNATSDADNQQGSRSVTWLDDRVDPSETTRRAPGG